MTDIAVVDLSAKNARKTRSVPVPPFRVHTDNSTGDIYVELVDKKLIEVLQDLTHDITGLYNDSPRVSLESLFDELGSMRAYLERYGRNAKLTQLVRYLEASHTEQMSQVKNMLKKGVISFSALRLLLKNNQEVVVNSSHPLGGKISHSRYRQTAFGDYIEVGVEYVSSNGREFATTMREVHIYAYKGVKPIEQLTVSPITDAVKQALTERGRIYQRIGVGAHYVQFSGQMEVNKWYSYSPMRANGRCMIDTATHNQFKESMRYRTDSGDGRNMSSLSEDQLWMTDPYVYGFSFVTKQWGRFPVNQVSEIQFRDDAYSQLVLDPQKKAMVRALVEDNNNGFTDLIEGKGGGCIFLLHGEPGVGKTLTAEAVSELLRRPLYSVSVGELGTDTTGLETNLRQILDVAQIWNAVILIDEADIFLEKRGHDIMRTAMTGIFLKMLEYHQGVMFLTTNRVQEFDSAFYSRISIALKYDALDQAARRQIWQNLLDAADVQGLDVDSLSEIDINGRQIKNTIRLAQSLARQEGVPVSSQHVYRCADVGRKFLKDINTTKGKETEA